MKITDMKRVSDEDGTVAWFNIQLGDIEIRQCRIKLLADGFAKVYGPAALKKNGRHGQAVGMPSDKWNAIVDAALREYGGGATVAEKPDDAGVRRFLGEDRDLRRDVRDMVG